MKIVRAALLLVLLAGPAYAQMGGAMNMIPEDKKKTPEEIEREAVTDKAYRDSLREFPIPSRIRIRGAMCAVPTARRPLSPSRAPKPAALPTSP